MYNIIHNRQWYQPVRNCHLKRPNERSPHINSSLHRILLTTVHISVFIPTKLLGGRGQGYQYRVSAKKLNSWGAARGLPPPPPGHTYYNPLETQRGKLSAKSGDHGDDLRDWGMIFYNMVSELRTTQEVLHGTGATRSYLYTYSAPPLLVDG